MRFSIGNLCRKWQYRNKERYIFHHDNSFKVLGLLNKEFTKKENLDLKNINIWVCDSEMNIMYGTYSKVNKLNPVEYIGKNIYSIEPKDLGKFCGDLHKQAQETKVPVKINVAFNDRILYVVVKPLIYFGEVVASALLIIPYKTSDKSINTSTIINALPT